MEVAETFILKYQMCLKMEPKVLCFHSKDKDIFEMKIIFVPGTYSQENVPGTNFKIFLKVQSFL